MTKLCIALAISVLTCTTSILSATEAISLFDGKTLKGWNTVEKDQPFWSVKDGAITADSLGKKMPRNTFLFSDKEYDNFEFRCLFKLTGKPETGMVNSGIQFRSAKHGKSSAKGYQADIGEPKWWGCLYDEHRRGLIAKSDMSKLKDTLKPFGWNEYRIVAKGPVLTLYLNGIETIQYIEKDPKIPAKGHFALQLHSGGICTIAYKDITVTPLEYKAEKQVEDKEEGAKLAPGDSLFEDFESGTYKNWKVSGTAFGKAPIALDKVPEYQGDLRAQGKFAINSHASASGADTGNRDKETGTLTSAPFTISHDFISMRIGGGNHSDGTCVTLMVDNKKVASLTGNNSNAMSWKTMSTSKWKGKQAKLQIVDSVSGGWGNIGVDEIIFTNSEKTPAVSVIAKKKAPPKKKKRRGSLSQRDGAFTPEEQRAGFTVPEGYVVELVASEDDGVINPVDITFDDAGRLWTGTAGMYPLDPNPSAPWNLTLKYMREPELIDQDERFAKVRSMYQRKTLGTDKILVMEPLSESLNATVWAEGVTIPQSILPYKNGAFIAHGSEMLYLEDTNKDGKADKQTTILSGFGFADTHTMTHLLTRAPGGWIHYNQGALNGGIVKTVKTGQEILVQYCKNGRFKIDGTFHELINAGLNNIWGYHLRANGQWFGSEANDHGQNVTPMEPGTGYKGIGNERLRDYQPFFPPPNKFRVGGTGLSGLVFAEDEGGFSEQYQGAALLANPITSKINAVRTTRNPDGTVTAEHLPDFLTSKDDWFRPVNIVMGPDGCLYIADFYNKIISHNEVARDDPERDKSHGRIWRVRYTKSKVGTPARIADLKDKALVEQLKAPAIWAKHAAWHQIVDRQAKNLSKDIRKLCADETQTEATRIAALWALEGLGEYDKSLIEKCIGGNHRNLRREAVRSLASFDLKGRELSSLLRPLLNDEDAMMRSQVIRTLSDSGDASPEVIDLLVAFCQPNSPSEVLGGPYERKFERYLARMALEKVPAELNRYLRSTAATKQPTSNIDWASKALKGEWLAKEFLKNWTFKEGERISEEDFLIACDLLSIPSVNDALNPVFKADDATYLVELALKHPIRVRSAELDSLITPVVARMLNSADKDTSLQAVVAADHLQLQDMAKPVSKMLPGRMAEPDFVIAASAVLAQAASEHNADIKKLLATKPLPAAAAIMALDALVRVEKKAAIPIIKEHLNHLSTDQQTALAYKLTQTPYRGGAVLLDLMDNDALDPDVVNADITHKIASSLPKEQRAQKYKAMHKKSIAANTAEHKKKIAQLKTLATSTAGKAKEGKALFDAMCLSCHSAGGKGAGFAPPLDGSGHRELEHMLTAIVDPDAAFEGNYGLYRVFLDNGSKVEGYLEQNTDNALRLRFMGGGSMDIPHVNVSTSGFVSGKSVMPKGLIDGLSADQKADLIAYIRSMK